MLRWLASVSVVLSIGLTAHAGPLRICTKYEVVKLNQKLAGSVVDMTNNHRVDRRFYSEALGEKRDMYVYLPPGYDGTKAYPLLIWLHGFIQDEKDFLELSPIFDTAIVKGELPPMIIASPDGSIRGNPSILNAGSFYVNSRAGRFEDYLVVDVWNVLVTHFPIRPEPEAHILAGASMGGFAAFNLGIKYRNRFKVAVGILPPLNLRYADCHGRYFSNFDPNCFGYAERYRPHYPVGRFAGGLVVVKQALMIDPLYGRNRRATVENIARENPIEMLETYNVKPGELSMFIGYAGQDEFNLKAQTESFLYVAGQRSITPKVVFVPEGRHNSETGLQMMPAVREWLKPMIAPYAPPLTEVTVPTQP